MSTGTCSGVSDDAESNPGDTSKSFIAPRLEVGRGRRGRGKEGRGYVLPEELDHKELSDMTVRPARACLPQISATALMKGFSGLKQGQTTHPSAEPLVLETLPEQYSQQVLHI